MEVKIIQGKIRLEVKSSPHIPRKRFDGTCFKCGCKGHMKAQCRAKTELFDSERKVLLVNESRRHPDTVDVAKRLSC